MLDVPNVVVDESVDVALHAGGNHKVWMGFFTVINFMVSPGQMRVMAVFTVEGADV